MSDWYMREMEAMREPEDTLSWRLPRKTTAEMSCWSEEDAKAPTLPPSAFVLVKACACSARYDLEGWSKLRLVGRQDDGEGGELELRDCAFCGSTISIKVTP